MTFHPRKDWTSTPPANAHRMPRRGVKGVAVHWNGPAVPKSALTDPRAYLEGVRRFHTSGRGWSDFAYQSAVDQLGNRWQGRGFRHMSAANGDEVVNREWGAILAILGEGQVPSAAMLKGIRREVRRFRLRHPFAWRIRGHQDVRPAGTACPGPDLERAVKAGVFRPLTRKPKPVPPPPVCNAACPAHCP